MEEIQEEILIKLKKYGITKNYVSYPIFEDAILVALLLGRKKGALTIGRICEKVAERKNVKKQSVMHKLVTFRKKLSQFGEFEDKTILETVVSISNAVFIASVISSKKEQKQPVIERQKKAIESSVVKKAEKALEKTLEKRRAKAGLIHSFSAPMGRIWYQDLESTLEPRFSVFTEVLLENAEKNETTTVYFGEEGKKDGVKVNIGTVVMGERFEDEYRAERYSSSITELKVKALEWGQKYFPNYSNPTGYWDDGAIEKLKQMQKDILKVVKFKSTEGEIVLDVKN